MQNPVKEYKQGFYKLDGSFKQISGGQNQTFQDLKMEQNGYGLLEEQLHTEDQDVSHRSHTAKLGMKR